MLTLKTKSSIVKKRKESKSGRYLENRSPRNAIRIKKRRRKYINSNSRNSIEKVKDKPKKKGAKNTKWNQDVEFEVNGRQCHRQAENQDEEKRIHQSQKPKSLSLEFFKRQVLKGWEA